MVNYEVVYGRDLLRRDQTSANCRLVGDNDDPQLAAGLVSVRSECNQRWQNAWDKMHLVKRLDVVIAILNDNAIAV
jgi:hypothetical protein